MAKPAARLAFLQGLLGLGAVVVLGRAFIVQVREHRHWTRRAEERDVRINEVPARRGSLFSRDGTTLAATFEAYHVSVAMNELRDTAQARQLLARALDIPEETVRRRFRQAYPYFDGPYDAAQVHEIRNLRGVHLTALRDREHPMGALAEPLLGRINRTTDRGIEGLEGGFDSLLAGTPGRERVLRDNLGHEVDIPGGTIREPVPGRDLVLTLDNGLQGVVEGALDDAVARYGARGGDVVLVDIRTGEVLAMASRGEINGRGPLPTAGALLQPFEPGSTAKLFTAAALLLTRADTQPVFGENGHWMMPITATFSRSISDVHRESGWLSLGRAIQVSSNIAMSKFSRTLDFEAQYRTLRAFGFGTQPGTGFPLETGGLLRRPADPASDTPLLQKSSWAMGYAIEASPLQIAMAYGAIANHGTLLAPTLLREVRDPSTGQVLWRHAVDTVRQAVPPEVASQLIVYLQMATDSGGTGEGAQLERWKVLGKTGTARLVEGGDYVRQYRASFAGIFPGDDPQFVLYVQIDRPATGDIYGGVVAAPVVRQILLQGLAIPGSPLGAGSRPALARVRRLPVPLAKDEPVRRVAFPLVRDTVQPASAVGVPDVTGWDLPEGLHAIQRRGLAVRVAGSGRITRTEPAPGDSVPHGATITIYASANP